ncbi:hypothetical protein P171DRAFT_153724 [Karstenula rhodostoma CBS 690.94]|uniref:MFS general substrate transporter n=1 Tax=Karstenula rhodostoma CBS 690.94 TaxID=1392251 RepID=A0A9P4PTM9_9PLEO|nr:hypothetical protein P171DRAFT_153724 [Karstenula rhodostoma CBS 690.94]
MHMLQNATELAEQRFETDSIVVGWYSATARYAGFFFVPLIGVFLDVVGHRISALFLCGTGVFTSMLLVCFGTNTKGTAASFGLFAFANCFGPTTIIDNIRTSMWHPSVFGSAYALKIIMNNAMNIIVRVVTGVIQDRDNNSYDNVTVVYVVLAGISVGVSLGLSIASWRFIDLRQLQWSRKLRISRGDVLQERSRFEDGKGKSKIISKACLAALVVFVLGGWCAYFWGVATGNNE